MEDINPMVGRSRQDSWMVMERAVDSGELRRTDQRVGRQGHLQPDRLRKIFRPEMKTTVQGVKAPRLYGRLIYRSEADLEDRGGGGHAPGI